MESDCPSRPSTPMSFTYDQQMDDAFSDISMSSAPREEPDRQPILEDVLYSLPVDEVEFDRQYKQHVMLLLALPGLYAPPEVVRRALAPEDGVQKSVLDIGTGAGTWAIAMANEFPHVEVVGIDLTPSNTGPTPPNCRFEFDDVNFGLAHYHGCFDVVHARSVTNGIRDFSAFIDEVALCLRPGGVILLAEGDFNLCGPDKVPLESASEGDEDGKSWFRRLLFEVYELMEARRTSLAGAAVVEHGLGDHPCFEQAGRKVLHIGIGPWEQGKTPEETRRLNIIGTLMRQNSMEFARAWKPLLLSAEYSNDTINDWIQRIDKELKTCSPPMYCRFRYCWGVKRALPGSNTTTTTNNTVPAPISTIASTSPSDPAYDLPSWQPDSRPSSPAPSSQGYSSILGRSSFGAGPSRGPKSTWSVGSVRSSRSVDMDEQEVNRILSASPAPSSSSSSFSLQRYNYS